MDEIAGTVDVASILVNQHQRSGEWAPMAANEIKAAAVRGRYMEFNECLRMEHKMATMIAAKELYHAKVTQLN